MPARRLPRPALHRRGPLQRRVRRFGALPLRLVTPRRARDGCSEVGHRATLRARCPLPVDEAQPAAEQVTHLRQPCGVAGRNDEPQAAMRQGQHRTRRPATADGRRERCTCRSPRAPGDSRRGRPCPRPARQPAEAAGESDFDRQPPQSREKRAPRATPPGRGRPQSAGRSSPWSVESGDCARHGPARRETCPPPPPGCGPRRAPPTETLRPGGRVRPGAEGARPRRAGSAVPIRLPFPGRLTTSPCCASSL